MSYRDLVKRNTKKKTKAMEGISENPFFFQSTFLCRIRAYLDESDLI